MILADTSIWVQWLSTRHAKPPDENLLLQLATCGPVLQEVLQGLKSHELSGPFQNAFLALPLIGDPVARDTYLHAADLYRMGRSKGYTIRSSMDCLIAALAIENKLPVWHHDRDYTTIARFSALQEFRPG